MSSISVTRTTNIVFIFIYLAAFFPQNRVVIIEEQQDLRHAISSLQILQSEVAEVKFSSSISLKGSIKSLQTLADFKACFTENDNGDANKHHILIASKFRSPHLMPSGFKVLNPHYPHSVTYTDEVTNYTSIEFKPEIPPPIPS